MPSASSKWLADHGFTVWMPPEDAAALDLDDLAATRSPSEADLAISLGGDGTMLRTVELLGGSATDILGVNVGQLGYLTEVEPGALRSALDRYGAGEYQTEERMMLSVVVDPVGDVPPRAWRALNEAVIERQESGHTVRLMVSHRRRTVHHVRGRRADRRHTDRLDGVLALRPRTGRLAPPPRAAAHPGVPAHALRSRPRARSRGVDRDRGAVGTAAPTSTSTVSGRPPSPRAARSASAPPTSRRASSASAPAASTRS